ncbi:hypothetical protein [Sphingomonas echinoides]|jgi:protein TonB|uniref:hypothetical protein n=1 Tax=Sphingomonas echinoides TaxID=59803 RepID=UPI003EEEE6A6
MSYRSESGKGRFRGIALALVVEALVALLLLQLGTGIFHKTEKQKPLITFDVKPIGPVVSKQAQKTQVAHKQKQTTTASAAPPPPVAPPPVKSPVPSKLIQLSSEEFAASDIGKIPAHQGEGDDSGSGEDSVAAYGPGQGPGGAALYNAEWLHGQPSRAEMAPYLRDYAKADSGSALIACKTAPDYRVENCRALDESPPGGGLARALRLAAWQFRVRPPRIGGKPMIGAWVRIRFDLTVGFQK